MEIRELLEKLSSARDVAAAALGYAAGYVADTYFFPGGLDGSVVAGVTAVGFTGVKKLIDVWRNTRRSRDEFTGNAEELRDRAEAMDRYLTDQTGAWSAGANSNDLIEAGQLLSESRLA